MKNKIKRNNIIIFSLLLIMGLFLFDPQNASMEEDVEVYNGGSSTERPGTITIWAGKGNIPDGYILCDGSTYTIEQYPELFEILGSTYGGNGLTTFKVPDFKGKISVGKDSTVEFNTIGKTGGNKTETLTVEQLPSHNHTFTGDSHTHTFNGSSVNSSTESANHTHSLSSHTHSVAAASGTTNSAGEHTHSLSFKNASNEAANYGLNYGGTGGYTNRMIVLASGNMDATTASGYHDHHVTVPAVTTGGHSATTSSAGAHTHTVTGAGTNSSTKVSGTIGNTGTGNAHNNLQPYIVLRYIIKY